ncbi:MAG: UbiD family decarboxylase [Candidatus Tectomicrobia bacterium]|uniref:UbiD family decarboxylase n=1 Tax=Tectimicrobiota bacterium TaxID=2528274 RepID=A0A932GM56_UNCTE|nr:UbiD family decarboxylase [Candidatus Tectomicrobia bacterium]
MFKDLRDFMERTDKAGHLRRVNDADWNLEVGALQEIAAFHKDRPALLFDRIKEYAPGYRIFANATTHSQRLAWTLGLPDHFRGVDLVRALREKMRNLRLIPPKEVTDTPLFENVHTGADIDLYEFPAPRWKEYDGGRYLGTGCQVVSRAPDEEWVNLGTYRVQVHGPTLAGLYMSPGRHAYAMFEPYWTRGEAAPVAVVVGADPTLLMVSGQLLPWRVSEYDFAGGLRGAPVEVVRGPITGLPLPATAEIVLEGEVPQPSEQTHPEGPFGEWTGYYASGQREAPVIRVKAIYHRSDPIILGAAPIRPPASSTGSGLFKAGQIWDELERAGVTDVQGVYMLAAGGPFLICVISMTPRYGGHARQAAMLASSMRAGAYMCRLVIVVDEDIDPSDPNDVFWAVATRCDPQEDIDIVRDTWGSWLDPRLSPEKRSRADLTMSRALIDATRPYYWRDRFPKVSETSPELRHQVMAKWADLFGYNL